MFNPNSLFYTDGYKIGHYKMLAPGTSYMSGTWIPRSLKHAPNGITKIVSFGQQLVVKWLNDEFKNNFFNISKEEAMKFSIDMSKYLGMDYDGSHFSDLHDLGYLPIRIKSLPEGIETPPNVPHMTFINTVDGFSWLTLYLETIISSIAWKPSTSATIALQYRRNLIKYVMETDPNSIWLVDYLAHDFSARGLSPWDMISSGLGHATSFRGSDTLMVIPASRYFYNEPENEVSISSVNASEHSVSTTKIFTVGEKQMLSDWMKIFPNGILSVVSDTFDLWKLVTEYLPELKDEILSRDGKLVIRPDSGNPSDIICGLDTKPYHHVIIRDGNFRLRNNDTGVSSPITEAQKKGLIEVLWDIFGGTVNESGYKILDPHIGAIYGDSITLERQVDIYERLMSKGFAVTNIVLGIGSYTYQMNTRDTFGFAAKGSWFKVGDDAYNIYKDPATDDGTKKSLKGLIRVNEDLTVKTECSEDEEMGGILRTIFENGKFYNQTTLSEVRIKINELSKIKENENTTI